MKKEQKINIEIQLETNIQQLIKQQYNNHQYTSMIVQNNFTSQAQQINYIETVWGIIQAQDIIKYDGYNNNSTYVDKYMKVTMLINHQLLNKMNTFIIGYDIQNIDSIFF